MLNLIFCEIFKFKHSKIVFLSVLGVLATPLLMFVESLQTHFEHPEKIFTLADIYDSSLLYVMLLTNFIIYISISAYLFSREYSEQTLKTILPVPVSRFDFISAKFLVLFFWIILLTLVTWMGIFILSFIYHLLIGLDGFGINIGILWLCKFLYGNFLIFLTISPFAYLAQKTKAFVAPVICASVIVMGSAAISNQDLGALYPWVATFFLVNGKLSSTGYPVLLSLLLISLPSSFGFIMTYHYFAQEDL